MMVGEVRRLAPQRLILDAVDAFRLRAAFAAPHDLGTLDNASWGRLALRLGGLWPRPFGRLRMFLVERLDPGGAPGTGAALEPPRELCVRASASGYLLFFDLVDMMHPRGGGRTPAPQRSGLAPGDYALEVRSGRYQPLTAVVGLAGEAGAREAVRLLLEPGFAYPFANALGAVPTLLFGELRADDPAALEGLHVQALGRDNAVVARPYRVDRRGEWALAMNDAALTFDQNGVALVAVEVLRGTQIVHSVTGVPVRRRRASRLAPIQVPGS